MDLHLLAITAYRIKTGRDNIFFKGTGEIFQSAVLFYSDVRHKFIVTYRQGEEIVTRLEFTTLDEGKAEMQALIEKYKLVFEKIIN